VEDGRVSWLALNACVCDEPRAARILLKAFPSAKDVFETDARDIESLGVPGDVARKIAAPDALDDARKELERLERKAYTLMTLEDDGYPGLLKEIFDPPLVLYVSGRTEVLKEPSVAVVGARRPTPYGRAVARKLAGDLASRGVPVVSGLARGIDACAHWGALESGRTVAVLGSGLEDVYPPENRDLAARIGESGAVVTEYPLDAPPLGFHFPLRNRIISGLARGVVVVEASRRSGSLISARLALEENREVMAVPGNVTSDLSRGTNWLLQSGARLVAGWEDVAEAMPPDVRDALLSRKEEASGTPVVTEAEKAVLGRIPADAEVHIDELAGETRLSISELLAVLLELELKGLIVQNPGKYFQRRM
jgi:DNA processing protein